MKNHLFRLPMPVPAFAAAEPGTEAFSLQVVLR
jgi:hypothetical protein